MSGNRVFRGISIGLVICTLVPCAAAAGPAATPRASTIHVRLIAREQPIAHTSFSDNWDSYIAELQHKNGERELIRLSYRFLYYEPEMPHAFLDYSYVHRFRAVRDEECGTTMAAATRRYTVGREGKIRIQKAAFRYASDAPTINEGGQANLSCYVVRPSSHTKTTRQVHHESRKSRNR
jgi:hypothetical protein